jgi:N-acetylglucosaminyldiphosphoundecaprenol N-acetyl-beta-D-mannosaminyltransferase
MNKADFIETRQARDINSSERVSICFLNRKIDFMTMEAAIKTIVQTAVAQKKIIVANYNVHAFNLSMLIPQFLKFYETAEYKICDGMGIIKGLDFMGISLSSKYKTPLTLLVPLLLEYCDRYEFSVFLLGSKPQHIESALKKQQAKYPQIKFAGHHGYFDKENSQENRAVIEKINRFKPDILIVGMGMPLQEIWIQQNYDRLDASVIIPCGAVIDRLAGLVPDCPRWLSNFGLEWLYRLTREPKRLASRYLLGNPLFLLNVLWAKIHNPDGTKIISRHDRYREQIPSKRKLDLKNNKIINF